ncbi:MAG: anthranilate synthase component I family protein [Thermoplasmata archaeon]
MTDPWAAFERTAEGREVAGYFEVAPRGGDRTGRAVSFLSAAEVRTVTARTQWSSEARYVERFLRGGTDRAAIGFLGFDAVGLFEPCLRRFPTADPFPIGEFALIDRPNRSRVPPRRLRRASGIARHPGRPLRDSLPRPVYERSVRRLVEEIRNGEAYQVVLAHRREWRRPDDLLARAGRLRASERYAFFYYLRMGPHEIVGATPESVVEIAGDRAFLNPIAGTIPRGPRTAGRVPLALDPKELAEHRMLVDLARNDLGSVARPGSVRLLAVERLERFARLDHLVTHVGAKLRPGVGPWQVLSAAFPAGTVSGAPKIRATELLRREEASWRGPYAGTVGLLERHGRADWALGIRTAFAAGQRLYTAAGAGIVHRSEPRREYDETLAKLAQVEATLVGGLP